MCEFVRRGVLDEYSVRVTVSVQRSTSITDQHAALLTADDVLIVTSELHATRT